MSIRKKSKLSERKTKHEDERIYMVYRDDAKRCI
jgi:hypothetical protein